MYSATFIFNLMQFIFHCILIIEFAIDISSREFLRFLIYSVSNILVLRIKILKKTWV